MATETFGSSNTNVFGLPLTGERVVTRPANRARSTTCAWDGVAAPLKSINNAPTTGTMHRHRSAVKVDCAERIFIASQCSECNESCPGCRLTGRLTFDYKWLVHFANRFPRL